LGPPDRRTQATETQAANTTGAPSTVTRQDREYQSIIAYVAYSQALKGAAYMSIAKELEVHAGEELQHALKVAKMIDYLGGMPSRRKRYTHRTSLMSGRALT
jgi:bacterioferritin (cytochrome b1)